MKPSLIDSLNRCWEKSNDLGEEAEKAYASIQAEDGEYNEDDYKYYNNRSSYYFGKAAAFVDVLETLGLVVVFRGEEGKWGRYHAFN